MIQQEYTGGECETTFAAAASDASDASDSFALAASAASVSAASAANVASFSNAAPAAADECATYNSKQCVIESSLLAQVNGC